MATIGWPQDQLQKPKAGSALRKAVLDGLRPTVEKDLKQKVIFQVSQLRVYKGWALVFARPLQPRSKPIDFKKTHYREDIDAGMFDGDSLYALLRLSGKVWKVKTFVIGPTDVAWSGWMGEPYHAPKTLFPPPFGPGKNRRAHHDGESAQYWRMSAATEGGGSALSTTP